jgi:hypothetical protein
MAATLRTTVPVAACIALLLQGCGAGESMERRSNIKPPAPGTPATAADVTGIYRSIHQGLLQLRADGSLVLIVPEGPGPTAGTFTLEAGTLRVRSDSCGAQEGSYDVVVTGEQEAGKAVLILTAVDDQCAERRHYLTVDPWVYANS